jgi:hypothetical protein
MVLKAFEDKSIDPRVFGPVAAAHIINARYHQEHGDIQEASQAIGRAIQTADSKSCPMARKQAEQTEGAEKNQRSLDEDEFGSLTFTCTEGHWNRRPRGKLISKCKVVKCKGTVGC